jgi:predicted transcriptional regulator
MVSKELKLEGFTVTIPTSEEHPVFKPWELRVMQYLWAAKKPVNSKQVWDVLTSGDVKAAGRDKPVSRASVINFLKRLTGAGVLRNAPESGKGGYHGLYTAGVTPAQLYDHLGVAVQVALEAAKKEVK